VGFNCSHQQVIVVHFSDLVKLYGNQEMQLIQENLKIFELLNVDSRYKVVKIDMVMMFGGQVLLIVTKEEVDGFNPS
jgi:hypothetical protein